MNAISIITPVFNRLDLLKETAQSVLSLNGNDWEWILVDDGSDPEILSYIDNLQSSHQNIIAAFRDKNKKGAPACRNKGAEIAKYDYLLFLDSDDILGSTAIETRLDVIKRNPFNDFWIFPVGIFNKIPHDILEFQNLKDDRNDLDRFCYGENVWQTLGVVWKKDYFRKIGGFDEKLPSFQDWELSVRAIIDSEKYFYHILKVPDAFYRITEGESISLKRYNEKNAIGNSEMILDIFSRLKNKNDLNENRRISLLNFFISRIKYWNFIDTNLDRNLMIRTYINKALQIGLIKDDFELNLIKKFFFTKITLIDKLLRRGNRVISELENNSKSKVYFSRKNFIKKFTYTIGE